MAKKLTKGKRSYLLKLLTLAALDRLVAQNAARQATAITNERQRRAYMAQYC